MSGRKEIEARLYLGSLLLLLFLLPRLTRYSPGLQQLLSCVRRHTYFRLRMHTEKVVSVPTPLNGSHCGEP